MERVAAGDCDAFAEFYDATAASAYGLIRRILRDPATSEEVAQDVMIELLRTAAGYDAARSSITGWVLTLAHRRAIDRVRAEHPRQRPERDTPALRQGYPIDYDHATDQTTTHLDADTVRDCLTRLTRLQRATIELAYYDGYTYPEVAESLGESLPAVKDRMRAALHRLRDCLHDLKPA
ncbi:sigma-70 family RNA polymerase sigma factor [Kribbella qitaiheensis]|uniref:Sigma-70 family RNA polymerase sigma factor n=1 Tax=Kribbella qitaiheensis TaxID=1544730 RepID=A0A7G6X547_9ACTN|nr:sigma-70 family RNA polymerase sigma factor [Kribbella qitaiheensis]QNE21362.1 sigma-70 family RNA polymerase sigma factor [Kribbella qitaiheensis]